MKRKAAAMKPAGAGVLKKCKAVSDAVLGAEGMPADVLKMLGENVADSLGVAKEDRHPYQEKVISMLGEVLAGVGAAVQATIAAAEAKVAESGGEKSSRTATEETAAAVMKEKSEESDRASTALAESAAALKAAETAEKAAEKELKASEKALEGVAKSLAKLQGALTEAYLPMKEAGSSAHPSGMATLEKVGEEFGLNNSLLTSLASALAKLPEARGSFDGVCLQQVEDELTKLIGDATEKVAAAEGVKAASAEKVAAAKAATEAATATNKAAADAEGACKIAVKEATADLKAASKAVKMFAPEMKQVESALASTKADLSSLQSGALAAYAELMERSKFPPPQPPAAEEPASQA
jgi:hypothetical protein